MLLLVKHYVEDSSNETGTGFKRKGRKAGS